MTDQPKITSDPIEPEPVWRGGVMTRKQKTVVAVITIIGIWWAGVAGYIGLGMFGFLVLFSPFILWNWVTWPSGISYRVSKPWDVEAIGKVVRK